MTFAKYKLTVVASFAALALAAPPAGAAVRATPSTQTVRLGETARLAVNSSSRCRLVSGIGRKRIAVRRGRDRNRIAVRPGSPGTYRIRLRCGRALVRAVIVVRQRASTPGTGEAGPGGAGSPVPRPRSGSRLGTNVAEVNYYNGATPFANLVMQAGDWLDSFEARADGYPAALGPGNHARVAIAEAAYPSGTYRVSWRGEGRFTVGARSFEGRDGRGEVVLDGESLVMLDITSTLPADPLRDIRVTMPGETGVFSSRYLSQLAPYGVLRFMDWQRTNADRGDSPLTCSTRTREGAYSQGSGSGASIEMMISLANLAGADPWFAIPDAADDSFVRCLGQLVSSRLRDDLVPRFEFSNETWNPAFPQFERLEAAGSALGDGDRFLGLQRAHARSHRHVMGLLSEQLGARPMIRVMAGQAANSWVLQQRLEFENTASTVDEIAIAPYVGEHQVFEPGEADRVAGLSADELFASLNGRLDGEVADWIGDHVRLAGVHGKKLIAYEGGQHLAGPQENSRLTGLFTRANRDARMGTLYERYFALWDRLTGKAQFVHYSDVGPYSRFGSWGALERSDQDPSSSPKYQAILKQAAR